MPEPEIQLEDDVALVAAARNGDTAAFGRLVERHQRRIYGLAFSLLRNGADAWDVAQESFVRAYKNLDRFEGQAGFYTWLYRITYNLSLDYLRTRARRDQVPVDDTRPVQAALEEQGRQPVHPSAALEQKELRAALEDAMAQLSDKHRAIIVLREVEGLSYEEMAEVLEISKGTVMSRLFHARKNLQRLLMPYLRENDEHLEAWVLAAGEA